MTPPDRLLEVYRDALDRPKEARTSYLDTACDDDPALRHEIEHLLAVHDRVTARERTRLARRGRSTVRLLAVAVLVLMGLGATLTIMLLEEQTARRETHEAHRRVEAITALLEGVLLASMGEPEGRDEMVAATLAEAAEELSASYPEDPLVEAALHRIYGLMAREMGDLEFALSHLAAALVIHERELGPADERTRRLEVNVSALEMLVSGTDAQAIEAALQRQVDVLGAEHPDTLVTMTHAARVLADLGETDRAIELLQAVIATRSEQLLGSHPTVLVHANDLAVLLVERDRLAEAEELLRYVADTQSASLGDDHRHTLVALENLAQVLVRMDRDADAIPLQERLVATRRRTLGVEDPATLDAMGDLSESLQRVGRSEEAEVLLRELLDLHVAAYGDDDWASGNAMYNLGAALRAQGKLEEAEPHLVRAVAIATEQYGADDLEVAWPMWQLGLLRSEQERHDEAVDAFEAAFALVDEHLADDDPFRLRVRAGYGVRLVRAGRHDEAEPILLEMHETFDDPEDRRWMIEELVTLYETWGKPDDAASWREQLGD